MQLSVRLVPVGETTLVIALTGELDSTTRPVLAAFLDPLPRSQVKYVVVAASDLWFCDLNGLEQFAITHRAMQAKGGHLAVAEAQPPLRRLITLMTEHARPAIPVYVSMPEALADTDVEIYEMPAPPTPLSRHLPRLRNVPSVERDRPRARREPQHDEPGPAAPGQAIVQSRTLRPRTTREPQVTSGSDLASRTPALASVALAAGPVAQIVLDLSGNLALANARAEALFELDPRDVGRPFHDLEASYRPVELCSIIERARHELRPIELREVTWHRAGLPEGSVFDVSVVPLLASGSLVGMGIHFTEVTRHRRLRDELEQANRRLEQAYDELRRLNDALTARTSEVDDGPDSSRAR
ncbi:STAS domain-containing protein [Nonomuraea basaltis]|uniref:STAS domain-containing protein n=1 Tax=Nonomuraea basaltis TaxID=2495887 RepID=UPI001F0E8ED8|nr:STAS domain-containing protein [Nonomuraea basaltis]